MDAPTISRDSIGRIQLLIRWMIELHPAAESDAHSRQTLDSLLQALLHEHWTSASRPRADLVAGVRRYVYENLRHPIRLDDLADLAGMSKFHFARRFAAMAGDPPMSFVRRIRVESTRSLLLTSPMPLRAIAPLVGFADEFELSRVFRRETGQTPAELRKKG